MSDVSVTLSIDDTTDIGGTVVPSDDGPFVTMSLGGISIHVDGYGAEQLPHLARFLRQLQSLHDRLVVAIAAEPPAEPADAIGTDPGLVYP